jgi:FG-GAP repeat
MGIQLSTNFDLAARIPLDSRYIVNTYSELTGITMKYSGMQGYVASEKALYYLQDLSLNKWSQLSSGTDLNVNNIVYTTGSQTIAGLKTFSTRPQVNGSGVLLQGEASNGGIVGNAITLGAISGIDNNLGDSLTIVGANNVYEPYNNSFEGGTILIKGGSGNLRGGSVTLEAGNNDPLVNPYLANNYININNYNILLAGETVVSSNLNVVGNLQAQGINVEPANYLDKTQKQEVDNYVNFNNTLNIKDNLFHYSQASGTITGFNQINFPNFTGKGDGGYFLGGKKLTQNTLILKEDNIGSNYIAKQLFNGQSFSNVALSSDGKYITVTDSAFFGKLHISQDYGNTWYHNPGFSYGYSVAMSSCGKYQTITTKNPNNGYGTIYVSNDYGMTWVAKTNNTIGIYRVTMTSDGKTQIVASYAGAGYISNDYGQTWSTSLTAPTQSLSVAISSNGKYIIYGGVDYNNRIYISRDYGNNWSLPTTGISWFALKASAHPSHSMSSDGQYQATVRISEAGTNNGYIYVSKNYGDVWSAKSAVGSRLWSSISMSDDGKYMAAAVSGGFIYVSKDYGDNWLAKTGMGTKSWNSVKLNGNAKYLAAAASDDFIYISKTDEQIDGNLFADNFYGNNLVYNTGNQTVSGIKTFATRPVVNGTPIALSGELSNTIFTRNFPTLNQIFTTGESFGNNISINEDETVLIAGLPLDDTNGENNGAAAVYTKNNRQGKWEFKQKITGDGNFTDFYGLSTAVNKDGSVILLGGPYDSMDGNINSQLAGAVLIYTGSANNGWSFAQKISGDNTPAGQGDYFGTSTSISSNGDILLIGAKYDSSSPAYGGSAFIFTGNSRVGWKFKQKLINDGSTNVALYGINTAMSQDGSIIAVSATQMNNKGAVFIHTGNANNGWSSFIQKISGQNNFDYFGQGLSINNDGNILVVGAPNNDNNGNDNGAVYIYTGNLGLFTLAQTITGSVGVHNIVNGNFGQSVSINNTGNYIIIGSPGLNYNSGAAYVYAGNATNKWVLKESFLNNSNNVWFGYATAIKKESFVIGYPGAQSIYIYDPKPSIAIDGNVQLSGNIIGDLNIYGNRPTVNGSGVMLQNEVLVAIVPPETVYTTGDQTIGGVKTFSNRPNVNGVNVLLDGEAASLPTTLVYTTGNQNINGSKTFTTDNGSYVKSELFYTNSSFSPTNFVGDGIQKVIYLNSIVPFETSASNVNTTGVSVYLDFASETQLINQLDRHIRTQSVIFSTGIPLTTVLRGVNLTGYKAPWTPGPQFISSANFINLPLEDRLHKIESSGAFCLLPNEKMGVGTYIPSEKLHVAGNLKVDGNAYGNNLIYNTGNQNISGTKTFLTNSILYSGVNVNFDSNTNVTFSGTPTFKSGINSNILFNTQSANFSFDSSMNGKMILINSAAVVTGTLPVGLQDGYNVSLTQVGAGKITIAATSPASRQQRLGLYSSAGQYAVISLINTGSNGFLLYGDLN